MKEETKIPYSMLEPFPIDTVANPFCKEFGAKVFGDHMFEIQHVIGNTMVCTREDNCYQITVFQEPNGIRYLLSELILMDKFPHSEDERNILH